MAVAAREEVYLQDIKNTIAYLKLRKIKKMIEENQADLLKEHTADEQVTLLQTHQALKQMERDLLKEYGTVIVR